MRAIRARGRGAGHGEDPRGLGRGRGELRRGRARRRGGWRRRGRAPRPDAGADVLGPGALGARPRGEGGGRRSRCSARATSGPPTTRCACAPRPAATRCSSPAAPAATPGSSASCAPPSAALPRPPPPTRDEWVGTVLRHVALQIEHRRRQRGGETPRRRRSGTRSASCASTSSGTRAAAAAASTSGATPTGSRPARDVARLIEEHFPAGGAAFEVDPGRRRATRTASEQGAPSCSRTPPPRLVRACEAAGLDDRARRRRVGRRARRSSARATRSPSWTAASPRPRPLDEEIQQRLDALLRAAARPRRRRALRRGDARGGAAAHRRRPRARERACAPRPPRRSASTAARSRGACGRSGWTRR